MEEVGPSTSANSRETGLLEMSQIFIRQLKESEDREIKLQEKIRLLEKERDIQNGPAAPNQQQHGVQELHQQIVELTQQFRQLKSNSDEKVQRLSNEVVRLEAEAKDKDAKIKDMTVLENAHQSTIDGVRTERDELQKRLGEANAQLGKANMEIERLTMQREEALKQVDDLRKTNEDMNASAALTISERESARERLNEIAAELRTERSEKSELQTRIRVLLEDNNKMLKDTIELLKGEQARAASHPQLDRETFEFWAAGLRRSAAYEREKARRN